MSTETVAQMGDTEISRCPYCNVEMRPSDYIERMRVETAHLRAALEFYTQDKWQPVADYSDNYWYMSGKPWEVAETALGREKT